jgi:hypothetical protein
MRNEPQGPSLSSGGSRILVKYWLRLLSETDGLFGLGSVSMGNTCVLLHSDYGRLGEGVSGSVSSDH